MDAPEQLLQELRRGRFTGRRVAIGTVTDPYQPAERRLGLTRRILQVLSRAEGLSLSITTKSDLVLRDLDLLEELARRHRLNVDMTVVTVEAGLALIKRLHEGRLDGLLQLTAYETGRPLTEHGKVKALRTLPTPELQPRALPPSPPP